VPGANVHEGSRLVLAVLEFALFVLAQLEAETTGQALAELPARPQSKQQQIISRRQRAPTLRLVQWSGASPQLTSNFEAGSPHSTATRAIPPVAGCATRSERAESHAQRAIVWPICYEVLSATAKLRPKVPERRSLPRMRECTMSMRGTDSPLKQPGHPVQDEIGLFTDLYELTMLQAYLEEGLTAEATFSLFVRHLPRQRNFLLACGLGTVLDYLERLRFSDAALTYLRSLGRFSEHLLDWLREFQFTGDVYAVAETLT
jgi:hypothetical protein